MRLAVAVVVLGLTQIAWGKQPPNEDWPSDEAHRIAEVATVTHKQAQQGNDPVKYEKARQLYQEYLSKYPDKTDGATLTFFYAELLFKLERYDEASRMYERVMTTAPKGKHLAEAAYAFMVSTRNAVGADDREVPDAGAACPGAGPCAIPANLQRLLGAFDKYLAAVAEGGEHTAVEYRRARIYYDYHQYAKAAPLFDAIVMRYPQHELAGYSANLELDCWALLNKFGEARAAIARFKKSPLMQDDKVRQQIEQLETALKKKP